MNREEALKHLHAGKRVKYAAHDVSQFFFYDSVGVLHFISESHQSMCEGLQEAEYELVKETKTVKLWQFVDEKGHRVLEFITEDKDKYWDGASLLRISYPEDNGWIKTNCYIEVEVEE